MMGRSPAALERSTLWQRSLSTRRTRCSTRLSTRQRLEPRLVLAGPILLGVHVVTLWIWVIFRQYEAADGHSGYDFPGNPATLFPGYEGGLYHDYHHARVHGNYAGFFSYLDAIFGTYCRGYLQHRARLRLQRTVSRHSPL
mgnify:CR=1 FL=1